MGDTRRRSITEGKCDLSRVPHHTMCDTRRRSITEGKPCQGECHRRCVLAAKKPSLSNPTTMARVHVSDGVSSQSFFLHKSFLCYYSPVFEKALQSMGPEPPTIKIRAKPEVFNLLAEWIYTQKVIEDKNNPPPMHQFVDLWLLAERYEIPRLQNFALDGMEYRRMEFKDSISYWCDRIYLKTSESSLLRKYAVELAAMRYKSFLKEDTKDHLKAYPEEMIRDMVDFMQGGMVEGWERSWSEGFSKDELNEFFV